MTWKFVTTWPRSSHTKPDPDPTATSMALRLQTLVRRVALVVMYATDAEAWPNTSMVLRSSSRR